MKQEKEPAASCSKGWAEPIAAPSSRLGVDVGQICFPEHGLGFGWPQRGPRLQLLARGKAKLAQVAEESSPSQGAKPQRRSFPLKNAIPSKPKRFTKIKAILAELSFGGEKENNKKKGKKKKKSSGDKTSHFTSTEQKGLSSLCLRVGPVPRLPSAEGAKVSTVLCPSPCSEWKC